MSIFDRPAPVPTGPTNVNDVTAHDLLKVMFGELQQISKKLDAPNKKQEYITIGAAGYNFDALGYRNSVLVVANTGTLTVSLAGFSYTVSLQVGPNQVNFPDGCTIKATTPVEGVLIRDNFPIFRSENVAATIADGADVTLGAQNDAAVTDYTASASAIALYKGILETLKGTLNTQLTGSNVKLLSGVTTTGSTGTGFTPQAVGLMKSYIFEVYGTATSFDIQIQAVGPSGTARNLKVWDELNETYLSGDITTAGFYSVDTPSFTSIQANVVSVSGGNVSVSGGLMQ